MPKSRVNSTPAPAASPVTSPAFQEIGSVEKEVISAVTAMRARATQIVNEIGQMEIRKLNLAHELNRLENQSSSLLKAEALRLGIPEGAAWQLTPEGKALLPVGTPT